MALRINDDLAMSEKTTLVAYYTNTSSNKYLAERIAKELHADIEPIRPRVNSVPFLLTCSLLKFGPGIKSLEHDPARYDRLIVCGPIWNGQFIAPLRDTIQRYREEVNEIVLVTCCGSRDVDKTGRYGYSTVFDKAREVAGGKLTFFDL